MPLSLSPPGPVKVPLCTMGFVRLSRAGLPSVRVLIYCWLRCKWCQMSKVETAGDCGQKDDPWLLCTTRFSCCHTLNYALKQQCIVLCMFTNPIQKGISIGFLTYLIYVCCFSFFFVHHASFQGLYLSEVIANLLQSCKLQCRASFTIMQNGTLSVNCSHATLNVRVPKHSLYTST